MTEPTQSERKVTDPEIVRLVADLERSAKDDALRTPVTDDRGNTEDAKSRANRLRAMAARLGAAGRVTVPELVLLDRAADLLSQSGNGQDLIALRESAATRSLYIASKTIHAPRWRYLRDKVGEPIISSWINEAGEGQTADWDDLWARCLDEASRASATIVYHEPGETLKGALVEVGAALSHGRKVIVVGEPAGTWVRRSDVIRVASMKEAIAAFRALPLPDQSVPSDPVKQIVAWLRARSVFYQSGSVIAAFLLRLGDEIERGEYLQEKP